MTRQDNPPGAEPSKRPASRLKIAGFCVLLLGGNGAMAVYWLGRHSAPLTDDSAMLGFNRAEHRQMGLFFGKSGYMVDDLLDALKQPGNQALLIIGVAVVIAAGCFLFARLPASHPDHDLFKSFQSKKDGEP